VLLYGAIEAPFAQPRAVFFGHTLSAITGVIVTKLFETNEGRFLELRWLAGAIACATAAVVMTITKTIHPPSGATAMIAATQADITALGWYYIPVVMLSAALAIGVGLITNNIQRRYPVFWLIAGKIPHGKVVEAVSETPPPKETPPSDVDQICKSMEHEKYRVIITSSDIVIPDFLSLEDENTVVLKEIQALLSEHRNRNYEVTNVV
jgi:CBS-domain-containing membrane protein